MTQKGWVTIVAIIPASKLAKETEFICVQFLLRYTSFLCSYLSEFQFYNQKKKEEANAWLRRDI